MKAIHLQTDYLTEPLGLGNPGPRFYWNCEGGVRQTAYRIVAKREGETIWDSGKAVSSRMTHIAYEGSPLHSRDRVDWSVTLWDENGRPGEPAESRFEMGLLEPSDWKAQWITGDYKPKKNARYPADCFRKRFSLTGKTVRARLYASARGLYDVWVNGQRIEDFILAPGMTDYRKRIQYQTYDVTELLDGENTLEIRLADGWYRGSCAAYGVTHVYGVQTSVSAQLEIVLEDGTGQIVCTDSSWEWSCDGPLRFADLKDGEIYEAGRKPSYGGRVKAVTGETPRIAPFGTVSGRSPEDPLSPASSSHSSSRRSRLHDVPVLTASDNVPVREKERFSARLLKNHVLDFGQNIAGYLEFTVKGEAGQKIRLVCGEVLDEAGNVDLTGIQETRPAGGWSQMKLVRKLLTGKTGNPSVPTPRQEILFTCSGGEDHYKTSFAIFGFRYVQIETTLRIRGEGETDGPGLDPAAFTAIAVYSDMEQTGDFICSNELVNRLVENTRWSMKGNFLELPTDCPTRERLGWTGDAQIFFDTGAYLMNTAPFFRKWLVDMEDAVYPDGLLPAVLPYQGAELMYKATGSSVGWADAVYLIPWRYYLRYGDKAMLERCWPMMEKYAEYLLSHLGLADKKAAKENPHNDCTYEKGVHLGEWLEPEEFRDPVYGAKARHPEECTAYLFCAMHTIGKIAALLGRKETALRFEKKAEGAKRAYKALFVKTGALDTDRQAKLVRPLALGLLEGEEKKKAQKRLVRAVQNYRCRVGTGFLSTPFLLPVLTAAGETETAYRMLENTEKPGWLAEVLDGATTIWENWEGNLSQNHYSPGAVCQWLFESAAGIRVDGENHFQIAPLPGGTLSRVKAVYKSPYGRVSVHWERTETGLRVEAEIPANTTAEVILPDGRFLQVGAGKHSYDISAAKTQS